MAVLCAVLLQLTDPGSTQGLFEQLEQVRGQTVVLTSANGLGKVIHELGLMPAGQNPVTITDSTYQQARRAILRSQFSATSAAVATSVALAVRSLGSIVVHPLLVNRYTGTPGVRIPNGHGAAWGTRVGWNILNPATIPSYARYYMGVARLAVRSVPVAAVGFLGVEAALWVAGTWAGTQIYDRAIEQPALRRIDWALSGQ